MFRALTAYEKMVMAFHNRANDARSKAFLMALAGARTNSEFESVLHAAIDRYEDLVSDPLD